MRAYLPDEPDHEELATRILRGPDPVISSVLARLELSSAVNAASRAGRLRKPSAVLRRFDHDCSSGGPISLLRLRPEERIASALRIVNTHPVRTLDALHLAVAVDDGRPLAAPEPLIFLTRDSNQASAARALGLHVE